MSDPGNREAPEGFKRNYSEMTNSFNSSNITNIIQSELKEFMTNITNQLSGFRNMINTNMVNMKNEMEKSIGKQIQDNNA